MRKFLDAARRGRHGVRDYAMMLMSYRHGLRVSELVDLRMKDMDLETGRLYVRRKKGSLSTHRGPASKTFVLYDPLPAVALGWPQSKNSTNDLPIWQRGDTIPPTI